MNTEKFSQALNEIDEKYLQEALQYRKKPLKHSVAKWGAAAACLVLLALGIFFFPFPGDMTVSAYTSDTNEEITVAGLTLLTGAISDSGEMTGRPLTFYLSGEDIATVRFSCKNQALSFMDWTKEWPEYGKAGNFTVAYGEDESQYYYLVIDWEPDALIRELTDNPDSAITSLPETMRDDLIVLEITFLNGKTATKAIWISLLDDGTFFASFDDYKISDEDAFVRRPDSNDIPRNALYAEETQVSGIADAPPMVYVGDRLYQQSRKQVFFEEKKADFVYLGKVACDITHSQGGMSGTQREHTADGAWSQDGTDGTQSRNETDSMQSRDETDSTQSRDETNGIGTAANSPLDQHIADGIPRKNFQANHPIVGAEIYQYGDDIVVFIDEKYWLYEAVDNDSAANAQAEEQGGLSGENSLSEQNKLSEGNNPSEQNRLSEGNNLSEQNRTSGENGLPDENRLTEEEKKMLDPSYMPSPSAVPEETNAADGAPETEEIQFQISGNMTEEILSAAEEAARAYYAGTVLEVVSMELKSQTEDTVRFSVSVKKGGVIQDPERGITLQLIQGAWEVVNEGY